MARCVVEWIVLMTTRPRSRPMDEASSYNPGLIARKLIQMSNKSWPAPTRSCLRPLNFSAPVGRSIGRSKNSQIDSINPRVSLTTNAITSNSNLSPRNRGRNFYSRMEKNTELKSQTNQPGHNLFPLSPPPFRLHPLVTQTCYQVSNLTGLLFNTM